jgi:hypothetical protein
MITILSALVSLLSFRVRSRISWNLNLSPFGTKSPCSGVSAKAGFGSSSETGSSGCGLYRAWPQVLNAMVLVKPTTVI